MRALPQQGIKSGWKRRRLGHLIQFRNGKDTKSVEAADGAHPVYGSGGEFKRADAYLYDGPSILFGRKGTLDKPLLVHGKFWTVDTMFYTIPGPEVDPKFVHYWALTVPYQVLSTDTAVPSMTSTDLGQLYIHLPKLETQRAIADYLDRETAEVDAMSADLDELEALLTERRDSVIEGLFLGGGTPDLASLPERWTRTTVGSLFSIHNGDRGVNYPRPEEIVDEGVPFINAGDLVGGRVDLEGCKRVSPEKYEKMGGAKLQTDDLLFCLRGSLGKWGMMESDGGTLASSLCSLRLEREDLADVGYIAHAMSTKVISLQIWFSESGSAQPNLGAEQVARFRVPLPPLEEQRRIAAEIDRETAEIDDMLADITELRDLLAERRAAVIIAAVTGQIDVPTIKESTHA